MTNDKLKRLRNRLAIKSVAPNWSQQPVQHFVRMDDVDAEIDRLLAEPDQPAPPDHVADAGKMVDAELEAAINRYGYCCFDEVGDGRDERLAETVSARDALRSLLARRVAEAEAMGAAAYEWALRRLRIMEKERDEARAEVSALRANKKDEMK